MDFNKHKIRLEIEKQNLIGMVDRIYLDKSNVYEVYKNNLLLWFYHESDKKKDNSKLDEDGFSGNIVNGWINNKLMLEFSRKKDGFELTESFYLETIKFYIKEFDIKTFDTETRKKIKIYKDYIDKKKKELRKQGITVY